MRAQPNQWGIDFDDLPQPEDRASLLIRGVTWVVAVAVMASLCAVTQALNASPPAPTPTFGR